MDRLPPLDFVGEVNKLAATTYRKGHPIAVGHPALGRIGLVQNQRFSLQHGMSSRAFDALLRDEEFYRRNWGWRTHRRIRRKVRDLYLSECGAIQCWDDIVRSRALDSAPSAIGGRASSAGARGVDDMLGYKASHTTVALTWSNFARGEGNPAAATYTDNPGAIMNSATTGAWPLRSVTAGNKKYLLNFGLRVPTGTSNLCMLVDLLVAIGNISTTTTATTSITTQPALTRYTDGVGVYMTAEVTAALGSTASNITVGYDGDITNTLTSTATAMTTSAITYRLQPVTTGDRALGGAALPVATTQNGVKRVNSVAFSASMGGSGKVAMLLFVPLVWIPTIAVTNFVETCPSQNMDGPIELVYGSDSYYGFLSLMVNSQTTSTGAINLWAQTAEG